MKSIVRFSSKIKTLSKAYRLSRSYSCVIRAKTPPKMLKSAEKSNDFSTDFFGAIVGT